MPFHRPTALLFFVASCLVTIVRAHLVGESSLTISADQENLDVLASLPLVSAAALLPADAEFVLPSGAN